MVHYAANWLSKELKTRVEVRHINFTLFNHVNLEGLYIEDHSKDTLLYGGQLQLDITDWFFRKDSADIKYVSLSDAVIHLHRDTDSIWNYQFIADYFSGNSESKQKTSQNSKGIALHLKILNLNNVLFQQKDEYKGKTTTLGIGKLKLKANQINLQDKYFDVADLDIYKFSYTEKLYKAKRSYEDSVRQVNDLTSKDFPSNPGNIRLHISQLSVSDGFLEFKGRNALPVPQGTFNSRDIIIDHIKGMYNNVNWNHDTLTAHVDFSARLNEHLPVKQLKADYTFHPNMMEFKNLLVQLNESKLSHYFLMQFNSMQDFDDFEHKVKLAADLSNTSISTNDIAFFAPQLSGKNQRANITGYVNGTIDNLNTRNIRIQSGGTNITGSMSMIGLPQSDKIFIDFNTNGSTIQLNDVAVWAPALNRLNTPLKKALNTVQFRGMYKGLINDFIVRGDILTSQGGLNADIKMRLEGAGSYDGKIIADQLNIGKLLGVSEIGKTSFAANIYGSGFHLNNIDLNYTAKIASLEFLDYNYININSNGILKNGILKNELNIDDPNFQGTASISVDLREQKKQYIGQGNFAKINFKPLHFLEKEVSFGGNFDVNFSGKNIDDFTGYIKAYDAHLYNNSIPLNFDSLSIYSGINNEGKKELEIKTNELYTKVSGNFQTSELVSSFQYFLSNYYPAIIKAPVDIPKNQNFNFVLNTKNINDYLNVFSAKMEGLNNSNISGSINTEQNEIQFDALVPNFKYGKMQFNDIALHANGAINTLNINGTTGIFSLNDSLSFSGTKMNISTEKNVSHVRLNTSSEGQIAEAEINTDIITESEGTRFQFNPSSFIVNNKKWTVEKNGEVYIKKNNNQIIANNLTLKQDEQELNISTIPDPETNSNNLYVQAKKINIGDLLPYIFKKPRMEGMASGVITVTDPLGRPSIYSDMQVDQFRFENDSIGILKIKGNLDSYSGKGSFEVSSPNKKYEFESILNLNIYDSTSNQLNAKLNLKHYRINTLEHYLSDLFDEVDGYADGILSVDGKLSAPDFVGDIRLTGGKVTVGYTKVPYFVDTGIVKFSKGRIDFSGMLLRDRFNNYGKLQGGFYHEFFQKMNFDLEVNSNKMELLHTTLKDNPIFYGNAVGRADFQLNGPTENLDMKIFAVATDSSHISIINSTTKESDQSNYIVFKKYGKELIGSNLIDKNLNVTVDVQVDNKTEVDYILDYTSSDIIKAWGNGKMNITNNKSGLKLKGRYDIDHGTYDYNFQSFIRRSFDLTGNGTNYIEWVSGDPSDANINISAGYVAKNVNFSDLNLNSANIRGDVQVMAEIKGKLLKPDIDFKLDFPEGSNIKSNQNVDLAIRSINDNANERLKQVTYLIVFNQFAPYGSGGNIRASTTGLAVNTVSEILSRELGGILSNVLYQITGDKSLQVDFSTSVYNSNDLYSGSVNATSYDRSRVNVKIGKSLYNNRIIIKFGSDFDFSVRNSAVSSFQFLPDVSVEFVLSPDRKLRAIIFKRDNLELGNRRNRVGASISYRQDFDKLF